MPRASLVLITLLCAGCAASLPAPTPMGSLTDRHPSGAARCLLVFLPGSGDRAERFTRERFVELVRSRRLAVDIISADATTGYYLAGTFAERLRHDVMDPANPGRYAATWLVGVSLGGLGSLSYAQQHPQDLRGVLALSPYLGARAGEIRAAGGLARWSPATGDADREQVVWRWLQELTVKGKPGPLLYLGWGDADRLAPDDALLGEVLPADRVFHHSGGHGWSTWRPLFEAFLAQSVFSSECAAP